MAEDWLKIDKRLAFGQKITLLAKLVAIHPEQALGRMVIFWTWVDTHVKAGGRLHFDEPELAEKFGWQISFFDALKDKRISWLTRNKGGLFIPDLEKWFGQSARIRISNTKRQRDLRHKNKIDSVAQMSRATKRDKKRDQTETETETENETKILKGVDVDVRRRGAGVDALGCEENGTAEKAIDWDHARGDANEVVRKLGWKFEDLTAQDRSLILKLAVLAQHFSEQLLWDSIEAVRLAYQRKPAERPKIRQPGYLYVVVRSKCRDAGRSLNALLKQIKIPDELQTSE